MYKVFIDGQAGTTGLQIKERLQQRPEIVLLQIPEVDRKQTKAKFALIDAADVAILCLPDAAAISTVAMSSNSDTRIIDASTAYRCHPDWAYGLPELNPESRGQIANSKYVSNPGCYPTGFLLALAPLAAEGFLNTESQFNISAISGYSGGGRQLIEKYELHNMSQNEDWSVRPYSLSFGHKHLAEMQHYLQLKHTPIFMPAVGNFHQGMLVSTPLTAANTHGKLDLDKIYAHLNNHYAQEPCVTVHLPNAVEALSDGFLSPLTNNNTNRCDIHIYGNNDQAMLVSQLDNLGKGASGAALQNLNIMLGLPELQGLHLEQNTPL